MVTEQTVTQPPYQPHHSSAWLRVWGKFPVWLLRTNNQMKRNWAQVKRTLLQTGQVRVKPHVLSHRSVFPGVCREGYTLPSSNTWSLPNEFVLVFPPPSDRKLFHTQGPHYSLHISFSFYTCSPRLIRSTAAQLCSPHLFLFLLLSMCVFCNSVFQCEGHSRLICFFMPLNHC